MCKTETDECGKRSFIKLKRASLPHQKYYKIMYESVGNSKYI